MALLLTACASQPTDKALAPKSAVTLSTSAAVSPPLLPLIHHELLLNRPVMPLVLDASAPASPDTDARDPYRLVPDASTEVDRGGASWYGPRFHGRRTASGERFDMYALTAAHRTLPFGTTVRVRSLITGREIDVRINDRGPFAPGRVIDVSRAAAEELGMLNIGVNDVVLSMPDDLALPVVLPPKAKVSPKRAVRPSAVHR